MAPRLDQLRLLLLQIRDEPRVRREEHESFACFSGLAAQQIDTLNVFDTPQFDAGVILGYDALLVGGASEASVLEPGNYPFVQPAMELLRYCVNTDFPVFASCFGFQLAVLALGGQIVRDQSDYEMGTIPLSLAEAAVMDPIFQDTPDSFHAVSVHKERATALPASCTLLAYTEACPHAFRVTGKPFWAFQFHPELDKETLIQRLTIFKAQYTDGDDHLDEVLASVTATPEANKLPRRFVERVLLEGKDG